eukprot:TRINITY_DN16977_c0_g2_i2.p1 TRINITY_DN16977_c0_g2~~TRINITY_DN16977_c0_g2_i2.p1  ORF type:complete len:286 (+),score=51.18 TRINITY_DN16977_c0_g2_i2:439-1296(+)
MPAAIGDAGLPLTAALARRHQQQLLGASQAPVDAILAGGRLDAASLVAAAAASPVAQSTLAGLGALASAGGLGAQALLNAVGIDTLQLPMMWAEVVSWDPRGFGFVLTEEGRRVYVHNSAFGGGDLQERELVRVAVFPDDRDPTKLMAKRLERRPPPGALNVPEEWRELEKLGLSLPPVSQASLVAAAAAGTAAAEGEAEWLNATVADWAEQRGFGFVVLEDNRRAYVHHSSFGGGSLQKGQSCQVVVMPDRLNAAKLMVSQIRGEAVVPRTLGEPPGPKRLRAG